MARFWSIRTDRPLVFSMGFNGYQWAWARNFRTQKAYALRCGYDYLVVRDPAFTPLRMECAWLKIPLLIAALQAGRPWVLFLDADVQVRDGAPRLESVAEPGKSLFMAHGFSGRINSGVILARQDPRVVALLWTILADALNPVPPEDDVGWGENGHVIHHAKDFTSLKLLPRAWNNNADADLRDHFRHYSAGPMRQHFRFTPLEAAAKFAGRAYLAAQARFSGEPDPDRFFQQLHDLFARATGPHPAFAPLDLRNLRDRSPAVTAGCA